MDRSRLKPFTVLQLVGFIFSIGLILFEGIDTVSAFQTPTLSQDPNLWYDVDAPPPAVQGARSNLPNRYRLVATDSANLHSRLAQAPIESVSGNDENAPPLPLPMPDGSTAYFSIEESPIMAPDLAAKRPDIKTYIGREVDDPSATARLDWTPAGFHAMILSEQGTVYIDPYQRGDTTHYISYNKRDYTAPDKTFIEQAENLKVVTDVRPLLDERELNAASVITAIGPQLRTYRLAVAATGEYTTIFDGKISDAQAAIVTTINRVTGIYEREVSVRLSLIDNTSIIYTNAATDPYSSSSSAMLDENQNTLDSVIGDGNYDVGHVFSTGGGGLAAVGVPCLSGFKALGMTGSSAPVGDPFDVDYVAHELGHQFGAHHTFNGNAGSCSGGKRTVSSAYEPGSGSTIMAYAGICGSQDLQPHSDDYFHTRSFDQIVAYTTISDGNSCPVITSTGNTAPVPDAGSNGFSIPKDTPFTLTGAGTDANSDPLIYNWEEYDLGPAGPPNSGTKPFFRSFAAASTPSRTFPRLSDILNNVSTLGEMLPNSDQTLTFRLSARDGLGGVDYDTVSINVINGAGPFAVTSPNTAVVWPMGYPQTITWDVANTDSAPVSCSAVDILLSTDGGVTSPTTLVANTGNDGLETIFVPNDASALARIKIQCSDNVFFAISDTDLIIGDSSPVSCRQPNVDLADPGTVTDILSYAGSGTIADLNVSIDATHTWVGDLKFDLEHVDTDTTVSLIVRPGRPALSQWGCSENDIDTTLNDEATELADDQCPSASPTINGTLQPTGSLSVFDGEEISGDWELAVTDVAGVDSGILNEWCLLPTLACSATTPQTPTVSIALNLDESISLSWTGNTVNETYEIHKGTVPYFAASGASVIHTMDSVDSQMQHTFTPEANTYYVVVGANCAGRAGVGYTSARTGQFQFSIVPGS
ncbi:MAG: hypothetical protein GY762_18645 [Proteobacteria bacterium]|nr:hypothetical protein [Pseudomonadota bacterium]